MRDIVRVLVPTDFSECSKAALNAALPYLANDAAALYVVHVIGEVTPNIAAPETGYLTEDIREALKKEADLNLTAFVSALDGIDLHTAIRHGNAARGIVRYADELDVDLIVMGTHGRHGWRRLFLGSTTEAVVRRAHCTVLTVGRTAVESEAGSIQTPGAAASHEPRVRDCMLRSFATVRPETSYQTLLDLLIHHQIDEMPVIEDNDRWVGWIYAHRLLDRNAQLLRTTKDLVAPLTTEGWMTPSSQVEHAVETLSANDALSRMCALQQRQMPVRRGEHIVGIVRAVDLLRALIS